MKSDEHTVIYFPYRNTECQMPVQIRHRSCGWYRTEVPYHRASVLQWYK